MRLCLTLCSDPGLRAVCGHCVSHLSRAHPLHAVLGSVAGLGAGAGAGGVSPPAALQPLCSLPAAHLTPSLCNAGHRTPASLGKRARPGWAARGVSQHPPFLDFFTPCPRFLSVPCLLVYHLFSELEGSMEGHLPSSPSLSEEGTTSHPPNPQPLSWILTPEGLGRRAHQEVSAGVLLRCWSLVGGSCPLPVIGTELCVAGPSFYTQGSLRLERLCRSPSQE